MADIVLTQPLVVYSPEWWLKRLLLKLRKRQEECTEYHDFYDGRQPLAFASDRFAQVFGRRYARLPANFMPLVVGAERQRLVVQGFRWGAPESDKGVWSIWQRNQLDAESQIAHTIALVKGVAYTAVDPATDGASITIEDPTETIVETAPGNRRIRLAALKVWMDEDGFVRAYLYLPETIYKFRSATSRVTEEGSAYGSWSYTNIHWRPFAEDGEGFPVRNRLGVVPIIPLLNRPERDGSGNSEIASIMGNQNAINKLRFDMLVASEYVAFPQRWATNIDIPIDPDTGQPMAPFKPGVDNLWATRRPRPDEVAEYPNGPPDPKLGQFPAGDLMPYIEAIGEEVGQMSAISQTPYHYFLGTPTSIPPSGESLKSSEATLVKKVVDQSVHFGEGWEETMRVALLAEGQTTKARITDAETDWKDPETRNEAARTDSILKQFQAGLLPAEIALEELGYSPQQIARIAELQGAQAPARVDESPVDNVEAA
jgi:hypothetical protein